MNGCDGQLFRVRWRVDDQQVTGTAGWMALYGCEVPVFRFKPGQGDGDLKDVAIAVQQWHPSAAG